MTTYDNLRTPDDVLALAREQTGLQDIESDSWREGLTIILDELNSSSAYSPGGRQKILGDGVAVLARRLQVNDYIKSHPEVLDAEVRSPLVVLGMPRTGTTVLSYLLDQDPARRSLLHWECVHPIPPATTETLRTDPRCVALLEQQQHILAAMKSAGRSLPHWEDADGPTEDMFIHNQDFKGLSWDAFLAGPRYAQWLLEEADMTSAYEYQKRFLQVLQSTAPGTWSLKMPSHSVHIDALLKVFPDARIIWAHRDPYKATGSLANMWKLPKGMCLNPDAVNLWEMGRNAAYQMAFHVNRPLAARKRIGDDRFFDVHYAEMMADPIGVMRRIYAWAGDPLTPEVEARMLTWLEEHPQDHYGVNRYTLDEYGLTVDDLAPVFADYLDAVDVALDVTV